MRCSAAGSNSSTPHHTLGLGFRVYGGHKFSRFRVYGGHNLVGLGFMVGII